ncbi:hypothetical protein [Flavobacterium sp.]|uniref:hypothetical protein n=1 Tax=Flavobacterium sp. TaxID=239 RepID=UPI003528C507
MKKILLFLTGILFVSCASKQNGIENSSIEILTQKVAIDKTLSFKIEKIISDSRCPENVQCIRLGEVALILGVYENNSKTEEVQLTIDAKHFEENKRFLESKISDKNKVISNIEILPKKIEGKKVEINNYKLIIEFTK